MKTLKLKFLYLITSTKFQNAMGVFHHLSLGGQLSDIVFEYTGMTWSDDLLKGNSVVGS